MAYKMQTSVPELMDIAARARGDPRAVRHPARRESVRQQLPAGAAAGRERRPFRPALPLGLGPARQRPVERHPLRPGRSLPGDGPADRRPDQRPQAARASRRDADRLGRRVRPDPDERGTRRLEVAGTRPQPARLHDLDGRGRRQARHQPTAQPTTWATTPSRTGCTSMTSRPRSST